VTFAPASKETVAKVTGNTWSKLGISPEQHMLTVETISKPPQATQGVVFHIYIEIDNSVNMVSGI
jgi:hypothetical protein